MQQMDRVIKAGKTEEAERLARQAHALVPFDPLVLVAGPPELRAVLERTRDDGDEVRNRWQQKVAPDAIDDGVALVSNQNTAYDPRQQLLLAFFGREIQDDATAMAEREIIEGHGGVGDLLRQWYIEETAAGNVGDLYDNHDQDHSNMDYESFPQLTRVEFSDQAKRLGIANGLQTGLLYNLPTIGNSSTAIVGGPYWRSQARLAYVNQAAVNALYRQYVTNHLYFYPEHKDHDPGFNGKFDGYGDVYPANTPYVVISQGSSGSDRPFMDAVACTLAAFRPEVKKALAQKRALMPTVQMILRSCYKLVEEPEDYLTGVAHPSVFDSQQLDVERMVRLAHEIQLDSLPPVVRLRTIYEYQPKPGVDYFDTMSEKLFDTPASIARVVRSMKYEKRMILSADLSEDLNGQELTYHWKLLRGDPERVTITPMTNDASRVEIVVGNHARRAVAEGSAMMSSRVDIGAFVRNEEYYSAPAFVTFYYLDSEQRIYNEDMLIESVQYTDHRKGGNYVDPAIAPAKEWLDRYEYDEQNRLVGWTRAIGGKLQSFNADGELFVGDGTRKVTYEVRQGAEQVPEVVVKILQRQD
jgi:hypothetical protein